jgi:hypothetical protein
VVTALGSGALRHAFGWEAINLVMAPFIGLASVLGFWLHRRTARSAKAPQPG